MHPRRLFQCLWRLVLMLALLPSIAWSAVVIDKTLTMNIYQLCNTDGSVCANDGSASGDQYFTTATSTLWAQAGIQVNVSFAGTINNTLWNNAGFSYFESITGSQGHFQSQSVVDVFFVNDIDASGVLGVGWFGAGGLVLDTPLIMTGVYLSTLAHELGHNLGLDHNSFGPQYLMSPFATSVTQGNLYPNGTGYGVLDSSEIALARQSSLLQSISPVPEAESYAMMLVGLTVVGCVVRRRRTPTRAALA
jgi:hypothetical protein